MNGHTNGQTNGEEAINLPSARPYKVSNYLIAQPPLTRRTYGPGLILLVPHDLDLTTSDKTLDPPPLQKWAEEGYAVVQISLAGDESDQKNFRAYMTAAWKELQRMQECDSIERLGVVCTYTNPTTLILYRTS